MKTMNVELTSTGFIKVYFEVEDREFAEVFYPFIGGPNKITNQEIIIEPGTDEQKVVFHDG